MSGGWPDIADGTGGGAGESATSPGPAALFRIEWVPGSDDLLGTCHCGARRHDTDPASLWDWLMDHPRGHGTPPQGGGCRPAASETRPADPALAGA